MKMYRILIAVFVVALSCAVASADTGANIKLFHTSPAVFIENQGQWSDNSILFVHKGDGANIAHTVNGPVFELFRKIGTENVASSVDVPVDVRKEKSELTKVESLRFSVNFDGANSVKPVGLGKSQTQFNFFIGDKANWKSGVAGYGKVAYKELYEGIDLYTWGQRDSLKYEFHVAPGSDYRQIAIKYSGIDGLVIADNGSMIVDLPGNWGKMVDNAPYIYQLINGQKVAVEGRFILLGDSSYSFKITGNYDATRELIIDPDIAWSTYLGGSGSDSGIDIVVDSSDNAFVTGDTSSSGWVSGGLDTGYNGDTDAFVVKLSSSGEHIWSTYLGGNRREYGRDIAIDASDNVWVTGYTESSGWGTGGWGANYHGDGDAFVVKLSPSGGLVWSTYLGGNSYDWGYGIAADSSGNVLVTGYTGSPNWISGGWNTSLHGEHDAFVVKLSSSGGYMWGTYLGGDSYDQSRGISVDSSGCAFVSGFTESFGWVSGGWDTSYNGDRDAFVVKLSPSGGHIWSTYLGGGDYDESRDIAVDSFGNVLVTGETTSSGWVSDGWDVSHNGGIGWDSDAFIVKLSSSGSHLWSTYLGGDGSDSGSGIAVDSYGNVLVTGETTSSDWVSGGWNISHSGEIDGFVAKFSSSGGYMWSTYLGGSGWDTAHGIAVDSSGNALVVGETKSSDWVSGGWDTSYNGTRDAFVAKIDMSIAGDANRDHTVNLDDFIILKQNYGKSPAVWDEGDFNGDGAVNLDDFILLKQNYGTSISGQ